MTDFIIVPPEMPSVAVAGSNQRFPIRRVFCVGRNYAAHAREMGKDPDREPPFFFMKPADPVVPASGTVPYMIPAMKHAVAVFSGDVHWRKVRPPLVELDKPMGDKVTADLKSLAFDMPGYPA